MCEVTDWHTALLAVWAAFEFWLGRTNKLDAGSTLELILNVFKTLLSFLCPLAGGGAGAILSEKDKKKGK